MKFTLEAHTNATSSWSFSMQQKQSSCSSSRNQPPTQTSDDPHIQHQAARQHSRSARTHPGRRSVCGSVNALEKFAEQQQIEQQQHKQNSNQSALKQPCKIVAHPSHLNPPERVLPAPKQECNNKTSGNQTDSSTQNTTHTLITHTAWNHWKVLRADNCFIVV